ncbi:carboxyl-terminal processing protease [Niveibacterium umoris]|uniref:Carboxyl-terminal processing protease n=1 Tax=Niveibacterium umoris TaxID=1193620 RepID=A0A840BWD0_9RHOO|nr:S41 family peptidase [Niveibacterium umoris]MBB4014617.1 carboxyl-terminal processing protease [Niveibacterium umoris]
MANETKIRSKLQQAGLVMVGLCAGVALSLNYSASANKEAAAPLPVEELRSFAEVFNAIKQGYVEPVDDKKLITSAISGMLSGLDPHSTYLDPEAYKDLQVGTQGEFGGLGIEVGMEDGFVKVISPIEDTPAFRAGVRPGDLIIKLDDTAVKGMTLNDAVKKMRGKPKTTIKLTIARKGESKPIELTLTREVIQVQSVKARMVEPGIAYLRVAQFQENTAPAIAKELTKLDKQGIKAIVLDLRNDPGGLLHAAVGVSGAFLPSQTLVVSTDGRTDDSRHKFYVAPQDYLRGSKDDFLKALPASAKNAPMVVLVNGASASASEIVAGALQDHKRAVVVGTQTFGKGSVQSILPLAGNTAIKLTTARYYTPSGRSIQAKGIVPDIVVDDTPNGSFQRLREADLDHHLETPGGNPEAAPPKAEPSAKAKPSNPKGKEKDGDEQDAPLAPFEIGGKNDHQLAQALNVLKGMQIVQQAR